MYIVPINKYEILNRLSRQDRMDVDANLVGKAFFVQFKERGMDLKTLQTRRKRFAVPPGQNITLDAIENQTLSSDSIPKATANGESQRNPRLTQSHRPATMKTTMSV